MSYVALYRKIRPRTFQEIVGQAHIVRALTNQLRAGQVSHAYLFCGTRGTGKTSAAKIFARAVNCLAPVDGGPCNSCEICADIFSERSLDVAEIDAASNNGVENIRDLREEVKFLPNHGKYKVYIVDEVHMLSGAAFNALLKTLEEPPPHVIFILATTDPQKIPATILSRCQRYDFRRISPAEMVAALRGHLERENLAFEDAALDYIAYHSDGAMRDALSLLDQCINIDSTALTLAKVRDLLGAVDRARLFEFADALAASDTAALMRIIDTAMADGRDAAQFCADLVRHFRDVLVAGLTGGEEFSAAAAAKFKEQAARISADLLMKYIHAFSETLRDMKFAPHTRTAFEVCALKMCMPNAPMAVAEEKTAQSATLPASVNSHAQPAPAPMVAPTQSTPAPPQSPPYPTPAQSNISSRWADFCKKLPPPIRSLCAPCEVREEDGFLKILCNNEAARALIDGKKAAIRGSLTQFFKLDTPPNLAIELQEAYNKTAPPPAKEAPPDDWATLGQEVLGGENF